MSFRTNRRGHKYPLRSRRGWSTAAKRFVDNKTNYLIEEEDMSPRQAYAVAISYARKEGYRIPKKHTATRSKKRRDSGYVPFASVASDISKRAG
jgi:hypothetical protein